MSEIPYIYLLMGVEFQGDGFLGLSHENWMEANTSVMDSGEVFGDEKDCFEDMIKVYFKREDW